MPTKQEHIDKQSNTQLALTDLQRSKNSLQHGDWIVTLAFYKAIHAVDSYFARQGIDQEGHDKRHPQRNQQVQDYLGCLHVKYSTLFDASIKARYEADTHAPNEVTKLVNHSVYIEEYIRKLLQSS